MKNLEKEFDERLKEIISIYLPEAGSPDWLKIPLQVLEKRLLVIFTTEFIKEKIKEVVESCPRENYSIEHVADIEKWRDNLLKALKR